MRKSDMGKDQDRGNAVKARVRSPESGLASMIVSRFFVVEEG